MRHEANRLRNIYTRTGREIDKLAWKERDKAYVDEIKRTKRAKWREFVSEADGKSIWQVKKYIDNKPT